MSNHMVKPGQLWLFTDSYKTILSLVLLQTDHFDFKIESYAKFANVFGDKVEIYTIYRTENELISCHKLLSDV